MGDNRPYIAVRTYADLIDLLRQERYTASRDRDGDRAIRMHRAMLAVQGAVEGQSDRNLASLPEDDGSW